MPMPRRCSVPPSTARTSPPQALPISPERGSGRPISCTGTTTSIVTAASATSPRHSAMPVRTVPCWPPATSCTSKHARPTRAAGVGRPATGRRSAPSRSTPSATASWPPQASGQRHPPSGRHSNHAQDRRPCYETSAATRLTRTGGALHRTAVVGMQHEGTGEAALGPDRFAHEIGGVLGAFARVDLPADDLAAEDVEDQVEVEEHAPDWTRHPGDVPAPDLAGAAGAVAGRRWATRWRLGPAAMVLLLFRPQDAVEAGLGRDIAALVCEAGHDLAGRQALEGLAVADIQHGPAFRLRQRVARCRPQRRRAAVLWRAVPGLPTTIGALVDPEL